MACIQIFCSCLVHLRCLYGLSSWQRRDPKGEGGEMGSFWKYLSRMPAYVSGLMVSHHNSEKSGQLLLSSCALQQSSSWQSPRPFSHSQLGSGHGGRAGANGSPASLLELGYPLWREVLKSWHLQRFAGFSHWWGCLSSSSGGIAECTRGVETSYLIPQKCTASMC